ncbi:MAG TPA: GNAT family protein [Chloroflexota bacterium]|nr:GNAT family protein [Chloroflexota bacterium]
MAAPAPPAEGPAAVPELRGDGLLLRPLRESDAADRRACGYDPEFERLLGHDAPATTAMTEEQAAAWLRSRTRQPFNWAIDVGERCVGTVGFVNLGRTWATLSIEIFDPSLWGRGLGTGAVRLVLGHAFNTLGLHRVELQVHGYNHRAIRAYEKSGFVREGIVRECTRVDGQWIEDVTMSILDREFHALSTRD